ncbi:MAG: ABC transporter permease [Phycisphaerae bacterium]|nr:ABC transporter permease [Phycisphaerae bacterium]MDD5381831.1 ABC transporter permease [Phycisphaerae bacterium]
MDETYKEQEKWGLIIQPSRLWFDLHLRDLWRYRDLIFLFVKRDFVTFYKQTALGPLWYIIQPLLTTVVFTVIFGKLAGIPMDGVPKFIFLLAGNVTWGYFAGCLNETSNTFVKNAGIFGKVYFPRLTAPVSVVIINLAKFGIQFVLFLGFYVYFITTDSAIRPTYFVLLLPFLLLQMAVLSLGAGILVSALTTKYRDLTFVMTFAVQLWMYASSVIIPASSIPEKYRPIYMLNPMTSVIESFRYAFFGRGVVDAVYICTSWAVTLVILFLGCVLFNRVEKSFMDTV